MFQNPLGYACVDPEHLTKLMGSLPKIKYDSLKVQAIAQDLHTNFEVPLGEKKSDGLYDGPFFVPELLADNIDGHFEAMAEELVRKAQPGIDFLTRDYPTEFITVFEDSPQNVFPPREECLLVPSSQDMMKYCKAFWTRFEWDYERSAWKISYPPEILEDGAVYDTETFVKGSDFSMPIMASAVTPFCTYMWLHPAILDDNAGYGYNAETFKITPFSSPLPQIGRDKFIVAHNCVPAQTEVLTKKGFIPITEIEENQEVLGFDIHEGKQSWTRVENIIYGGKQEILEAGHSRNKTWSTDGHRWVVKHGKRFKFETTAEFFDRSVRYSHRIVESSPLCDIPNNHNIETLILLGWYATDGAKTTKSLSITASKSSYPFYCSYLEEIAGKYKSSLYEFEEDNESYIRIYLNKGLREVFDSIGYKTDRDLPRITANFSSEEARAYIFGCWLGDGSKRGKKNATIEDFDIGPHPITIYKNRDTQERVAVSDSIQISLQLMGKKVRIGESLVVGKKTNTSTNRKASFKSLGFDDVYCLKTGLETFVIRQNNHISITGNSAYDAARCQERYEISTTPVNFFFCTMSAHQVSAGLNDNQRKIYNAEFAKSQPFRKYGSPKGLLDSYNFNVARPLGWPELEKGAKKIRDAFVVAPSLSYLRDMLPELLEYSLKDSVYGLQLFQAIWPEYKKYAPSKVVLAAHFLLSHSLMPVDDDWFEWVNNVDSYVNSLEEEQMEFFIELAEEAHRFWQEGGDVESDPWLSQLDWTIKGVESGPEVTEMNENREFKELTMVKEFKARGVKPVASWFITCQGGRSLTAKKVDAHHLLKLSYKHLDGVYYPVTKTKDMGWCYKDSEGDFHRVPHKTGDPTANVGGLISSDYLAYLDDGRMKSDA